MVLIIAHSFNIQLSNGFRYFESVFIFRVRVFYSGLSLLLVYRDNLEQFCKLLAGNFLYCINLRITSCPRHGTRMI